eukprot:GILK01008986.1.p1 GENE.GILK01008986.1~~GILK01008986.1.p1  ORF type:complete len:663 (-),score=68.86 GILK01008986.1:126-2090(-)
MKKLHKLDLFQTPPHQPPTRVGLIVSFFVLPACVSIFMTYAMIQFLTESITSSSVIPTEDQCTPVTFRCTAPSCNISLAGTGNVAAVNTAITVYETQETVIQLCAGKDAAVDIAQTLKRKLPAGLGISAALAVSENYMYFSYNRLLVRLSLLDLQTTESITMNVNEQNFTSARVAPDKKAIVFVSPSTLSLISVDPFARLWSVNVPNEANFKVDGFRFANDYYGYVLLRPIEESRSGWDLSDMFKLIRVDLQSQRLLPAQSMNFKFSNSSPIDYVYSIRDTLWSTDQSAIYTVSAMSFEMAYYAGISKFDIQSLQWTASTLLPFYYLDLIANGDVKADLDGHMYIKEPTAVGKYRTSDLTLAETYQTNPSRIITAIAYDEEIEFAYLHLTSQAVKVRLSDMVAVDTYTPADQTMLPTDLADPPFKLFSAMAQSFSIDSFRYISRVGSIRTVGIFSAFSAIATVPPSADQTYSFMATRMIDKFQTVSYKYTYTSANTPTFADKPCASNENQFCYRYNLAPIMMQVVETSIGSWTSVLGSIAGMAGMIFSVLKVIVPRLTKPKGNDAERAKADFDILTKRELQSGIGLNYARRGGRPRVLYSEDSSSHLFSNMSSPASVGLELDRFSPKYAGSMLELVTVIRDDEDAPGDAVPAEA